MDKIDPEALVAELAKRGVTGVKYVDSTYINGTLARHNFVNATGLPVTWNVGTQRPKGDRYA